MPQVIDLSQLVKSPQIVGQGGSGAGAGATAAAFQGLRAVPPLQRGGSGGGIGGGLPTNLGEPLARTAENLMQQQFLAGEATKEREARAAEAVKERAHQLKRDQEIAKANRELATHTAETQMRSAAVGSALSVGSQRVRDSLSTESALHQQLAAGVTSGALPIPFALKAAERLVEIGSMASRQDRELVLKAYKAATSAGTITPDQYDELAELMASQGEPTFGDLQQGVLRDGILNAVWTMLKRAVRADATPSGVDSGIEGAKSFGEFGLQLVIEGKKTSTKVAGLVLDLNTLGARLAQQDSVTNDMVNGLDGEIQEMIVLDPNGSRTVIPTDGFGPGSIDIALNTYADIFEAYATNPERALNPGDVAARSFGGAYLSSPLGIFLEKGRTQLGATPQDALLGDETALGTVMASARLSNAMSALPQMLVDQLEAHGNSPKDTWIPLVSQFMAKLEAQGISATPGQVAEVLRQRGEILTAMEAAADYPTSLHLATKMLPGYQGHQAMVDVLNGKPAVTRSVEGPDGTMTEEVVVPAVEGAVDAVAKATVVGGGETVTDAFTQHLKNRIATDSNFNHAMKIAWEAQSGGYDLGAWTANMQRGPVSPGEFGAGGFRVVPEPTGLGGMVRGVQEFVTGEQPSITRVPGLPPPDMQPGFVPRGPGQSAPMSSYTTADQWPLPSALQIPPLDLSKFVGPPYEPQKTAGEELVPFRQGRSY